MSPKIANLPTGLGALVAQALTNPQAMTHVLDGVREIAASIRVIKEQETAQAEIASKTQIEVARVQAVRDVMLSYLDKSFDERRANFEALFARVDQAAARGDAATVSAALDAVVSLGKSSPFKDLADVASAKSALKDKGREWEF